MGSALPTRGRRRGLGGARRASARASVRLQITADGRTLTAITQDVGNATEELDASATGTDLTVAFNPDYLAAGVEALSSEQITLSTVDSLKPAVVRGLDSGDYLYLLMPVRVP